jgi:precorrin-2 dehydrogenase/sirohydrochlorin ferrochelatase
VTTGRRLLIAGGGPETADRLSAALRFDWASITLVTLAVRPALRRLAVRDARVRLVERPVRESDVRAADVVIEGCGDPRVVERLSAWCRRHRRLLNAMDSPPHCDFHGTSFFARGPLLVSIASGGHAPALSAALRRRLEAAVGPGWQTAACLMAAARGRLPSGPARRALMKALAADADLMDAIARNDRRAIRARLATLRTDTRHCLPSPPRPSPLAGCETRIREDVVLTSAKPARKVGGMDIRRVAAPKCGGSGLTMRTCFALLAVLAGAAVRTGAETGSVVRAADHGAAGDGRADDGAAFSNAVVALAAAPRPAVLRLEGRRTYRIAAGAGYAIDVAGLKDVTVEGAGATLLLGPERRAVALRGCTNVTVRGLRIDYDPLPFAEAEVVAKDPAARTLDVRIAEGFAMPPAGGPTREGGEQAYFGMLWNPGPHTLRSTHCWIDDLTAVAAANDPRRMRVSVGENFRSFDRVTNGTTRMTVPVRGVAHRHGPGAVLHLDGNLGATVEDVEIGSAPWFACTIQRNEGSVSFRRVHVRPKPGTTRITSSWRDGIHAKGNRAALLFEDCILDGMNDDSFNLATFVSRVESVDGLRLRVRQNFPLVYIAWRVGDTLRGYSAATGALLGDARVTAVEETPAAKPDHAPAVTLTLDRPPVGVARGDQVWAVEATNPGSILRRCTIRNSCRLQTPVTLEACDVAAFLWFYGEHIEGPLPSGSAVRNCRLRAGRGNSEIALSVDGRLNGLSKPTAPPGPPPLTGLRVVDNEIDGRVEIRRAQDVRIANNRFAPERARISIRDSLDVTAEGNRLGDAPLPPDRITILDSGRR